MISHEREPILSRPVLVAALPEGGLDVSVKTTPDERAALAALDDLVSIDRLDGQFTLSRELGGQGVVVRGLVRAAIVQTCSVSLEPFASEIEEPVDVHFVSEGKLAEWHARHPQSETEDDIDPPDPIVDGRIDLGAVTAEFLTLSLDPYPRAPGVAFDAEAYAPDSDPSPFAALAGLKPKS